MREREMARSRQGCVGATLDLMGCSGARWRCPKKNLRTRDGVKKPPAGLSFVCSVNVQVPVINLFHLLWILIKGHGL